MRITSMFSSMLAMTAVGGLMLSSANAFADHDKGNSKSRGKAKGHYKNGGGDDVRIVIRQDDRWRRDDDNWRRDDNRYRNDDYRYRNDDRNRNGGWAGYEYDRRQQTKNDWRNLAIAGGVISILGMLNNDSTLTFAGAAGALYSAYRYEQDRKSQNRIARGRAYFFSQPYFYRDGQRYSRRTVYRGGERYYQFCRG